MLTFSNAKSDFDFDSPGKRAGFIDISHSDNRLAFSVVRCPVGVISSGDGPTVLICAGNHGDEYEGQAIVQGLMQNLTANLIKGRLILLPALNVPAVQNRARVSPLDQGNMNRSFPGASDSGPTGVMAGFVNTHLIPRADVILDLHSGGTTAEYVNSGFLCLGENEKQNAENLKLANLFAAPHTLVCRSGFTNGDFDTAAHEKSVSFLSTELGGGGRFDLDAYRCGWEGCRRILQSFGIIAADVDLSSAKETEFLSLGGGAKHVTVAKHGLAQMSVRLGDRVAADQPIGALFDLHNFGTSPIELLAPCHGVVTAMRRNPHVDPGDHLCLICPTIPRDKVLAKAW